MPSEEIHRLKQDMEQLKRKVRDLEDLERKVRDLQAQVANLERLIP